MNLAEKMNQWEKLLEQLAELESKIKQEVLELGATQVVGSVRATYSGGTKRYNRKGAGCPQEIVDRYTTVVEDVKIDWVKACNEWGGDVPFTKSNPSVSLKIQK